jgi:hydrogenase maturation protein HypF
VLATGAELKNAFCLTRDRLAFLSQHIGDLQNYATLQAFEASVAQYEALYQTRPAALAYDLHPDYLATRYALARAEREGLPALAIQHHHAHIAACMADAGLPGDRPVIGLACDGTGLGTDGAMWGGEFLIADYAGFERRLHLAYVPLPGGDLAVREPWRMALAWLRHAGLPWTEDLAARAACVGTHEAARRYPGRGAAPANDRRQCAADFLAWAACSTPSRRCWACAKR